MEVVINKCYGGFGLSEAANDRLNELKGTDGIEYNYRDVNRNDPDLVMVVKELGDAVNDKHAKLVIVQIPDDVRWEIQEYDGMECVTEVHRTWG